MDAKYLAEIRARCEAVDSARRGEGGKSVGISCWKLKENALADIPALLAEVERLNAYESIDLLPEQIEAMQGHNIALIEENAAKDQQIDTLKKALELMYADNKGYDPDGMGNPAWYIRRAHAQLIHESTHECDKSALGQEGNSKNLLYSSLDEIIDGTEGIDHV